MILIIDNGNNMILYEKIMPILKEKHGIESAFLTFSKKKYIYLSNRNINAVYLKEIDDKQTVFDISKIEDRLKDFTLNQCIFNDRVLKFFKYSKSKQLLLEYGKKFDSLLSNNKITLVVGEITWGVELLFFNICKYYNIKYVDPLNIYASSDLRLTFFDERHTSRYMKYNSTTTDDINIDNIIKQRKSIDINNKIGKKLRSIDISTWIKKTMFFIRFRDNYDYRYHFLQKKHTIKRKFNKKIINTAKKFLYKQINLYGMNYYYMPLHIQPEATPDIVSIYYNDQIYLIKQIAKSLPSNTYLIVKEHPNGIGARSIIDLKNINKIPNVILVDHSMPSNNLIKDCISVITIAGTAAIEARLHKKPVVIFSDIYFSEKLTNVHKCYNFNELPSLLKQFLDSNNHKEEKIETFIKWVYSVSFDCYIYDPFIDNNVLNKNNISKLAEAIRIMNEN